MRAWGLGLSLFSAMLALCGLGGGVIDEGFVTLQALMESAKWKA